jgi:HSP20 family protein
VAPFRAFTELEQEMHTLLDRIGARPWMEGFGWKPDSDIYRDGRALVVEVELPGVDPSADLEVHVEGNVLEVTGARFQSSGVDEADRYVTERRFGRFARRVMLPGPVDPAAVTADYANGLLTVRVPLPELPSDDPGIQSIPIAQP